MTSLRLKHVYNTRRWRGPVRVAVLERAGGQCEFVFRNVFGEDSRCETRDHLWGGTESLTVNHTDPYGVDPFDVSKLEALCRKHHGHVDGGRRSQG